MAAGPHETGPVAVRKRKRDRLRRRKKCGARNRHGTPCGRWALKGRERCRLHGGLTPKGTKSVHFSRGARVRNLPANLANTVTKALTDPALADMRVNMATAEALLVDLTSQLKEGKHVGDRERSAILDVMDFQRKLQESEARRLKDLEQMIPAEQHVRMMTWAGNAMVQAMTEAIKSYNGDPKPWLERARQLFRQQRFAAGATIELTGIEGGNPT